MAIVTVYKSHGVLKEYHDMPNDKVWQWVSSGRAKSALDNSPRTLGIEVVIDGPTLRRFIRIAKTNDLEKLSHDDIFRMIQIRIDHNIGS